MPSEIRFGFRRHFLKFNFLRSKPKYEISFLPSFRQIVCLSAVISILGGCAVVADVYGHDSATMNAAAAKDYMKTVELNKSAGNVDTTSRTARRVQAVFRRMLPYADAANNTGHRFDWKMTVFKNDELNAWAMPGGKMAFYTGIVDKLKLTDDEIAAIMGHEMTHALHEHGKNKVGQQILTNTAAQIGTQTILDKKPDTNPELVGLGMDILGTYGLTLPYSRSLEEEADEGGNDVDGAGRLSSGGRCQGLGKNESGKRPKRLYLCYYLYSSDKQCPYRKSKTVVADRYAGL